MLDYLTCPDFNFNRGIGFVYNDNLYLSLNDKSNSSFIKAEEGSGFTISEITQNDFYKLMGELNRDNIFVYSNSYFYTDIMYTYEGKFCSLMVPSFEEPYGDSTTIPSMNSIVKFINWFKFNNNKLFIS